MLETAGEAGEVSGAKRKQGPTGLLVLEDGSVFAGRGYGAAGVAAGEICFNTAMTGYQEILTDPSYAGQIIVFTFPHIGNVGVNEADLERASPARGPDVRGLVTREVPGAPSNWRAQGSLPDWLAARGLAGVGGVDTRALTRRIREGGMVRAALGHDPAGRLAADELHERALACPPMAGLELAARSSCAAGYDWRAGPHQWKRAQKGAQAGAANEGSLHVAALDYGIKQNILRLLAGAGCRVTVFPARTGAEEILASRPDGIFLSNGPGDPAASAGYAGETIRALAGSGLPLFGICLGHQVLALALGARTEKMGQGHHGANHPVQELATGKVEIVSMNHGFTVSRQGLPAALEETHVSLFDGTNCGLRHRRLPVFSVQFHPEASPGPEDTHGLFARFAGMMERGG